MDICLNIKYDFLFFALQHFDVWINEMPTQKKAENVDRIIGYAMCRMALQGIIFLCFVPAHKS